MMEFSSDFQAQLDTLFTWRRDVRHFRPDPVPEVALGRALAVAAMTPSVGLSQPWRFMRVEDAGRRARVREDFVRCHAETLGRQTEADSGLYARLKLAGLEDAPHHVAVFSVVDPAQGRGLGRQTMPQTALWSSVMAIHGFWLSATAQGFGVGWVSILDPARMAEILEPEPGWVFVAYLCVGYPVEGSETPELERLGWEHRRGERGAWILR